MNFLSLEDIDAKTFFSIIELAKKLKKDHSAYKNALEGKQIGLLFEKPSTRTRISFEVGINRLGGKTIVLSGKEIQISRGESLPDTARVVSQYLDALMVRTFSHERLIELSRYSSIPIINGLSDLFHPCQALADYMTIFENKSEPFKMCYVGDAANNVCHSLLLGASFCDAQITLAGDKKFSPLANIVEKAQKGKATVEWFDDPLVAAQDADVIYTDVWVSMGEEEQAKEKKQLMQPFQINNTLMQQAKKDAFVLHCLPAHKGEEISEEVFEKNQKFIFEQAQNRMHAQMALLLHIFGKTNI